MISSNTQKPNEDNRINFVDALNKKHKERWQALERVDQKKSQQNKEKERLIQRRFRLLKKKQEGKKTQKMGRRGPEYFREITLRLQQMRGNRAPVLPVHEQIGGTQEVDPKSVDDSERNQFRS